jgi:hypothetical protein
MAIWKPYYHTLEPLDYTMLPIYEGEVNKHLKYFLSRNLLNTKGTQ